MAIIEPNVITGKVDGMIFYKHQGKSCIRSKPLSVKNPRTKTHLATKILK